jgi:tungstate transport system ATP-binding protein
MADVNVLMLYDAGVRVGEKTILRDVSLSVRAGERVAVLGANGAGKSTLLRAAHGIAPLSGGTCVSVPTAQQAMIFQRAPMLRTTVLGHVLFSLKTAHEISDKSDAAHAALQACGLSTFASRFTRSLSGGEQQRLALACVWARASTKLLFADEATASLDVGAVQDVERLLLELNARDCALVFTTHAMAQAKRLTQRVVFLFEGAVADDCAAEDFFKGNCSKHARTFIEGERW